MTPRSTPAPKGASAPGTHSAVACANIALAKYWGKADRERNLPAVPSLSLTLDALRTETTVSLDAALLADEVHLDGVLQAQDSRAYRRVAELLDRVRALAGERSFSSSCSFARVTSVNRFPTAAGLASSASGFAALAVAGAAAFGVEATTAELSALARRSSASAARSLYGGYVELLAGAETAAEVAPEDHLPVVMLIALTARGEKAVGSTEAMLRTAATSPLYAGWLDAAPRLFERARAAVLSRDVDGLGEAMEASTLTMHATLLAAEPGIVYFAPATLAVLGAVRALRARGEQAYFTMDAGPHVKVLVRDTSAERVRAELSAVPGVLDVLSSRPGAGARLFSVETP